MVLSHRVWRVAILGGLTLVAFGLRAYRLDAQSYWIDEGWTLHYASLSPAELWHTLQTTRIVPPLYHFVTLYWSWLVGNGEYSMRFISVVCGVLSIPLTYRLGQALGGVSLGLIGALLMTVAPYQVWHAQDARNYTMLVAAASVSMWAFVALIKVGSGRWRWRLLYLLGTEWALLTHYHAVIVLGIQGLFLILTWRRRPSESAWRWRCVLGWGALLAGTLLLFGVWLYFGFGSLKSYLNWIPQPTLWETYVRSALAYSIGELVPWPQSAAFGLTFVAVFAIGLVYAASRRWGSWRGQHIVIWLLAFTLAPNLAAWVYGELRTPVYLERYLIPVQVGYLLGVAMGVLAISAGVRRMIRRHTAWAGRAGSVAGGVVVTLLVGISGWVLAHHYFDPAYAKPDWRTIAQTVEDYERPGDAVIITGDGSDRLFRFYYHGQSPIYLDFNTPVPPPERAIARLAAIAAEHRRLWYTPYGVEIDALVEGWLAREAYPAWQSWIARQRLALYATGRAAPQDSDDGVASRPVGVTFADAAGVKLRLDAMTLPASVAAGDVAPLTFSWVAPAPLDRNYQLSVRLVNAAGDRFAQADWPPLAAAGPTFTWRPEEPVTDRRGLWLPADVPPGEYHLEAAVYDADSGEALGAPQRVAALVVTPAERVVPVRSLGIPQRIHVEMGEVTLVGYSLPRRLQPGQDLTLWLYWQAAQAEGAVVKDATLRLSLVTPGSSIATTEAFSRSWRLSESVGPLADWQSGQVRRAVYHLSTVPRLTGDRVAVQVVLSNGSGEERVAELPALSLQQRPRAFEPPRVQNGVDASFGSPPAARLVGFDGPGHSYAPGSDLALTLYWQALSEMDISYTVFLQVLTPDWRVAAQVDRLPLAGTAPTNTWLVGEYLTDPYRLSLPADLAPGVYHIITGLYDARTGQRLPVSSGGDFVTLGTLDISG